MCENTLILVSVVRVMRSCNTKKCQCFEKKRNLGVLLTFETIPLILHLVDNHVEDFGYVVSTARREFVVVDHVARIGAREHDVIPVTCIRATRPIRRALLCGVMLQTQVNNAKLVISFLQFSAFLNDKKKT